ncbi:MAG TPA: glycosyltransferase family 2 protein [Gemmatimonadaceae bacterium]|nr:glycosyltransferase family 2 protein [Gemmatimonadaceae bacterium]
MTPVVPLLDALTALAAAAADLTLWPAVCALPWVVVPLLMIWRLRGSRTLDGDAFDTPPNAPLVSVIIPARNEAHNIARCLASVLGSTYRGIEVIVVDDRSEDETATIAQGFADRDGRVRVIEAPPLPDGWFGKQWACENGGMAANGGVLLFTDADTVHGPELVARAVNAMQARAVDMLSVVGRQEMRTFWERVAQPHFFAMIAMRFGGTGEVNASPHVEDKIANGQCIFVTRRAYETIGGHASVRMKPAEDLALAQRTFAMGLRYEMIIGLDHLSTRMYGSLREIVDGWTKNIWTAAPDAMPGGRMGRALLAPALVLPALFVLAPPAVMLAAAVAPVPLNLVAWGMLCTGLMLVYWTLVYGALAGRSPMYAFAFPLGAGVVLYTILRAIARGRRVEWKGRGYITG